MGFNQTHLSPGRGGHAESRPPSQRETLLKAPGKTHGEIVGHGFRDNDLNLGLSHPSLCPCAIMKSIPSHSPE